VQVSKGFFPLTPTLSLGERESHRPFRYESGAHNLFKWLAAIPPLPKGEGWGEGEQTLSTPRRAKF